MKAIVFIFLILFFTLNTAYSYVLVTGTQMQDSTDFSIDYDIEYRIPYIDILEDSLTQDTTIIGKLIPSMIEACITDVNPRRILVSNGPNYSKGSERELNTTCFIDYDYYPSWRTYGTCIIPPNDGNRNCIDILLNSNINKIKKWGVDGSSTTLYKNPKNTLTHELIHSVGIHHSPAISLIMPNGGATTNDPVKIGDDEKNAYKAIYNGLEIIEPDKPVMPETYIAVIKGQKVNFEAVPTDIKSPAYDYFTDIYKKIDTVYSPLKTDTLENDTVKFTWNTDQENLEEIGINFFISGAERYSVESYQENDETYYCNQRPDNINFSISKLLLFTPEADTTIVAEIGSYIPVNLKYEDSYGIKDYMGNVYNSHKMIVKYKLWYDGWLSNDTISTTAEIDPAIEFQWPFTSDGANNTININHPSLKAKGNYQITAWLYEETTNGLKLIDKVNSEEFRLSPQLTLEDKTPESKDYTTNTIFDFEATLTDINGQEYQYVDHMGFYYRQPEETYWEEIPNPVAVSPGKYTSTWNTENPGVLEGEYIVKATAIYFDEEAEPQTHDASDSLAMHLIKSATCVITNPKPAAEKAWDFEYAPYIYRGYYSDHSLESEAVFKTTLKDVDEDFMIFNGTSWSGAYFEWSTCPQTKYHWGYLGFENQWGYYITTGHTGELNGYQGWHNTYPFWNTLWPSKKNSSTAENINVYLECKRTVKEEAAQAGSGSKLVQYYDKGYQDYYNDYEHLYPGIYNAAFHAYDKNDGITDIANPASVDFLIPEWKLKLLNESKWLDYDYNSTTGPIYVDRTEYNAGEDIHFMIWRPFEYYAKNNLNYKITNSETGTTVFEKNLLSSDYLTDTFITNNYAPEDTLAYYHHILSTSSLAPGFYKIKAEGISLVDSINIIQEKEIQICPFYEQWENGGLWSADWPAPTGTDTQYWKIKNMGYNYYTANQFLLETHYETGFHLNETHSEDVCTLDNKYPAMLEISIAPRQLWDRDGDFWYWEEQYSKFTIELSKGGGDYVKVKTLDLKQDGYLDYPWNPPANPESTPGDTEATQYSMLCLSNFSFPIGELTGSGQDLKIRFGIEGMPEHFTNSAADNKETLIYVDEIKLWYMKDRQNRPHPRDLAAVQAKESNTVTLNFNPPALSTGMTPPDRYFIYRDGIKIAETTGTTFTDTEIKGSTTYNYVVVADYDGLDFYESSMLDCSIKYMTAPITYARPSYFALQKGIGLLDNCVTLEWLAPDPDVSYYEIYRNNILIGTTTELSYHDNLLPDGTYEYYSKARYGEETYQVSDATLTKSVSIYSTVLPIYEDYEHSGSLPLCWNNDATTHGTDNLWASGQTVNGIAPYEGSYSSYVSGESSRYTCACTERTGLRTPNIDLSSYDNITLSYKLNLYHKRYDSGMTTALNVYLFDNSVIDSSYCSIDDVDYPHSKQYYISNTNITRQTNKVWQSVNLPIDSNFVDCYFVFHAAIYNTDYNDTSYIAPADASVLLDAVSLTGTIDLGTPSNVTILRNSTTTTLTWDLVPGATEYKVYASTDPYGTFTLDTTGSWISATEWQKSDSQDKYFYYIVAASASKEILKDNVKIKLKSEKVPNR